MYVMKLVLKMILQTFILPIVYYVNIKRKVNENLVVFANYHSKTIPYSMEILYDRCKEASFEVVTFFEDYQKMSFFSIMKSMCRFMKVYANAGFVVICDYYLPVSACKKREDTKVIQLWHACGKLKKFGYDTPDDIPKFYFGKAVKNYDLVSVSCEDCVADFASAFGLIQDKVKAWGLSRTDSFFDEGFTAKCRAEFYELYPECIGKKVLLWAPSFRGKASNPSIIGADSILALQEKLGEEWQVICSLHPHFRLGKDSPLGCKMPTHNLLPVADLLVTDYSSVMFEYSLFVKPMVRFVPDYDSYMDKRGFYVDYEKDLAGAMVTDEALLADAVIKEYNNFDRDKMIEFKDRFMGSCDGFATDRLMRYMDCEEDT